MGAFAKAQEEGSKVFETLVKEGMSMQRKTQTVAEEKITEADKAAGFSAADLQEVIKFLQAIANNTAPQAVVIQIPK